MSAETTTASAGWTIETTHGNYASKVWRSPVFTEVTAELQGDALTVDAEVGSGYMREHTTVHVPVSVLIVLLRGAGYEVSSVRSEESKP